MAQQTTPSWNFSLCDTLEKVFPTRAPRPLNPEIPIVLFPGAQAGFQIAFKPPAHSDRTHLSKLKFEIAAPPGVSVSVNSVDLVPAEIAAPEDADDGYLETAPGLFPDLLTPQHTMVVPAVANQWRAVWVDLDITGQAQAQTAPMTVTIRRAADNEILAALQVPLRVVGVTLPALEIDNAHWFHCDGLADYYGHEVFSGSHWEVIDSHMAAARRAQVNTILTPTWTPPLDTAVGATRTPTQLIGITETGAGDYEFDFTLLERWIELCKKHGFRKLEIAHFFTQWGARATPAIYVQTPYGMDQRFGWHVAATDPQYRAFLKALVPQLLEFLAAHWGLDNVIFHISDEPIPSNLAGYTESRNVVIDLLGQCQVIDAVSDYVAYQSGAVPFPVVANDHAQPFLDANVPLWLYYCVAQDKDVSNRFMSLPSTRNRVIGAQLFATGALGFLHWGFNFYNAFHSTRAINPFTDTCAGNGFTAGDAFLVYPGPGGQALESIRFKVFAEAMTDLRAMELLRARTDAATVAKISNPQSTLTLTNYSYDPDFYRGVLNQLATALENTAA